MAKYNSFEEIEVYRKSIIFVTDIYKLIETNSNLQKDFGLKDQFRRAALSISNNIAEGFERETKRELIRFLYIAKGSAGECRNILNVINILGYINEQEFIKRRTEIIEIAQQLGNYIKYLKKLEQSNN
ncbi:four helix bundle protein [Capnocytophaga canimorsus]|uniref:four helix bundle protein n=1 Tax=Capnocytophaga canimorsus TaxID=28188 RepID=UPI001562E670|nr:four helix bundle protein [Capnocytophaga canimorsus]